MRTYWGALVFVLFGTLTLVSATAVCAAIVTMAVPAISAANTAVPEQPETNGTKQMLVGGINRLNESYKSHRDRFVSISHYSQTFRVNWWFSLVAFALFAALTLPRDIKGIRIFYRQMMTKYPLSAFRAGGVTDEDIERARKVLFFYLLFLLYQIVQLPMTIGRDSIIQFSADLSFQVGILAALVWSFHNLKVGLRDHWKDDPARQEKMSQWLNDKLDGMDVRWRDIRKLAFGVFIANFGPSFLTHLPRILDALSGASESLIT